MYVLSWVCVYKNIWLFYRHICFTSIYLLYVNCSYTKFEVQISRTFGVFEEVSWFFTNGYSQDKILNAEDDRFGPFLAGSWLSHPSEKYESQSGLLSPIYMDK